MGIAVDTRHPLLVVLTDRPDKTRLRQTLSRFYSDNRECLLFGTRTKKPTDTRIRDLSRHLSLGSGFLYVPADPF